MTLDKAEAGDLSMIVTTEDERGHSRVVAAGCHPTVATAAYTSATVVWPKERVLLRHGLRIMCERPAVKDDAADGSPSPAGAETIS